MVSRTAAHRRHGVPDDEAGLSPDYVAIVAALRKIPAGQRQAIVLHHLYSLSVGEIAQEVGVPTGTVKARLSRGRRDQRNGGAEPCLTTLASCCETAPARSPRT